MSFPIERQFYRLSFPLARRPEFRSGDLSMPVFECSERGFRYQPVGVDPPEIGDLVSGKLRMCHGAEVEVAGTVHRRQESTFVVVLPPPGVPFSVLMAEQRYLRSHFP